MLNNGTKHRSSHLRCSVRKIVLRNFTKFAGKHLFQSLFFNKIADLRRPTLLKIRLWRTVQRILTWFQQQKTGCSSWTKAFRLQSQIGVPIFASFARNNLGDKTVSSAFFVTVSWLMRHYGKSNLLSHADFLKFVLESSF